MNTISEKNSTFINRTVNNTNTSIEESGTRTNISIGRILTYLEY